MGVERTAIVLDLGISTVKRGAQTGELESGNFITAGGLDPVQRTGAWVAIRHRQDPSPE
jgi:hypothetical protein